MVERFTLTSLDELGRLGLAAPAGAVPRFNIAPLSRTLSWMASGVALARWGLLPPWRGHGGKRAPHVVHAPIESIDDTPLLRNAFKSQRCLILADGWFAWRRAGKKPQPLWLHPAPPASQPAQRSQLIALAGLAATHRDDDQLSFAMILVPADPLIASAGIADEPVMPSVLPADAYATWLTGHRDAARELLGRPLTGWRAEPVSAWANSADHDDPQCVEPIGNPAQGELF